MTTNTMMGGMIYELILDRRRFFLSIPFWGGFLQSPILSRYVLFGFDDTHDRRFGAGAGGILDSHYMVCKGYEEWRNIGFWFYVWGGNRRKLNGSCIDRLGVEKDIVYDYYIWIGRMMMMMMMEEKFRDPPTQSRFAFAFSNNPRILRSRSCPVFDR